MSFDIVSTAARKILYAAPGGPKCVVDYKTKITARTPADRTVFHRKAARGSRPADRRWFTFDHDFLAGQVQVNPNMEWLGRTVLAVGHGGSHSATDDRVIERAFQRRLEPSPPQRRTLAFCER